MKPAEHKKYTQNKTAITILFFFCKQKTHCTTKSLRYARSIDEISECTHASLSTVLKLPNWRMFPRYDRDPEAFSDRKSRHGDVSESRKIRKHGRFYSFLEHRVGRPHPLDGSEAMARRRRGPRNRLSLDLTLPDRQGSVVPHACRLSRIE
ncbi:hypothetical protein BDR22DRAFT_158911 [Usnea florida]